MFHCKILRAKTYLVNSQTGSQTGILAADIPYYVKHIHTTDKVVMLLIYMVYILYPNH